MNAVGQSSQREFPREHASFRGRTWLIARLVIAYGLLECALWTSGEIQKVMGLVFLGWVIASTIAERPSLSELGLGVRGLGGASIALVYSGITFAILIVVGRWFGTLRSLGGVFVFSHAAGYVLWSFIQEFILNSYFFLTLEKLFDSSRKAVWGAVFLFVLAHLPNPVLMMATLLLSLVFVPVFRRYRNVYPLGLGHAVLGLTIAIALPEAWLAHMRVGLGYLHFIIK